MRDAQLVQHKDALKNLPCKILGCGLREGAIRLDVLQQIAALMILHRDVHILEPVDIPAVEIHKQLRELPGTSQPGNLSTHTRTGLDLFTFFTSTMTAISR